MCAKWLCNGRSQRARTYSFRTTLEPAHFARGVAALSLKFSILLVLEEPAISTRLTCPAQSGPCLKPNRIDRANSGTVDEPAAHDRSKEFPRQAAMQNPDCTNWHCLKEFEAEWALCHQALKFADAHLVQTAGDFVKPGGAIPFILGAPFH